MRYSFTELSKKIAVVIFFFVHKETFKEPNKCESERCVKRAQKAGGSRRFPCTDQLTSSVGGSTAITQVSYAFALEDFQESAGNSSICDIQKQLLLSRLLDNIRSRKESGSASLTCIFFRQRSQLYYVGDFLIWMIYQEDLVGKEFLMKV